nr:uroporphyrinogen decarboxylase family protein [Candidatus Sigynarchaeum springense]
MNVKERIVAALEVGKGRMPDKVPNHFVSLRTNFMKIVEKQLEIKEENVVFDGGFDLTIAKAIGAESLKCGPGLVNYPPVKVPDWWFERNNIPLAERHLYGTGISGNITKRDPSREGEFDAWYVDGWITSEGDLTRMKGLMEQLRPPPRETLDRFNKFAAMAISKGICPIPAVGGPFTEVLEGMGWSAFARAARKNIPFIRKFADIATDNAVLAISTICKETDVKIVHLPDDIAMKQNVMLTPALMKEVFFPCYQRITEAAHAHGGRIFLHTDGFVEPLIPAIVDAGFDGLQCLESAAGVDIRRVKKEWGRQICLIGNVDCNRDLFYMTPAQLERQAADMVNDLKDGGGYIFGPSSTIYGAHPLENLLAIVAGWLDARDY